MDIRIDKLISVIVPVYNVKEYLEECLDSICRQTYGNLEIIVIDDGSTDGSGSLCDSYQQKDGRIKVIHQSNEGLAQARNQGILHAGGEYLTFVDSDDYIHIQMIENMYNAMKEYGADLVLCSHEKVGCDRKADITRRNGSIDGCSEELQGRDCVKLFYSERCVDMVVAWNKLYRTVYFKDVLFPAGKIHEDEFTTYKILYPLEKCIYLKQSLYFYRQREGSITRKTYELKTLDKIEALRERVCYFKELGDGELYSLSLRRFMTSMAENIVQLDRWRPDEKSIALKLRKDFLETYKQELFGFHLRFAEKLKFTLFLINAQLYYRLKEISRGTDDS